MIEYGIPCSEKDYVWARYGRVYTDWLLGCLAYCRDPEEAEQIVAEYNDYCKQYENDRCDYTAGELMDMYCGPFNIRPECFSVEVMYIQ